MELKALIGRMRCPSCKSTDLQLGASSAACPKCGHALAIEGTNVNAASTIKLSDEWEAMQEGSVDRYLDEHYEEDETEASVFGGFVAVIADAAIAELRRVGRAHCHYCARESLFADLARWKLDVRRALLIPGSTGILIQATPA